MIDVRLSDGQLAVAQAEDVVLAGGQAAVALSDGTTWTTAGAEATRHGEGWVLAVPGDEQRPGLRWIIAPKHGGLQLVLHLENTTGRPLAVERLDVLAVADLFPGRPPDDLHVVQTGWQSWSLATPPVPITSLDRPAQPPVAAPALAPPAPGGVQLPWVTLLQRPDGPRLLAGFTGARDALGMLAVDPAGARLTASAYYEGLALPPGSTLHSEPLLLVSGQTDQASFELYAEALAGEMQARRWPSIPTGWCSWYHFFTAVTEADMLRNLEALAARRNRWPIEVVQLDDGYQTEIGDWLSLNDKFPHGMPYLTRAIRSHGYVPGIWLAPFLVSERSQVYAEHPDWVLRDEQDRPIVAIHNWNADQYALDTTHPAVEAWLRRVVSTMVDEWRFDYLKIDFVYAAALRARRRDPNATSVQAYRRGVGLIREVAGDRFILGCGAPLVPSVGLVDGMRIGPDVAPFWRSPRPPGSEPSLHDAIRSTLAHVWMHRRLWLNDPDCVLLRSVDTSLTLAEVQAWISLVALSGGMVLFSDDLSRLEPERERLASLLLPPYSQAALPLGANVDGMPSRMLLSVERPWERWLLAAQFNWQNEPQAIPFDPADWPGLGDRPYHLFDFWTAEHRGPVTGPVYLGAIPAHGVRLLAVHLDLGRPQLVGSTLHALNGVVEIVSEGWDGHTLTLSLECPGEHSGRLAVYVPSAYHLSPTNHPPATPQGNLLLLPITLSGPQRIALSFDLAE